MDDEDFQLEDYLEKCRCCFRKLEEDMKFIIITDRHEKNFFDLTQIKVVFVFCEICGILLILLSFFPADPRRWLLKKNLCSLR